MATPTIPNGKEYFFPIIYEGNGTGQKVGRFVPFTDNGTIANSCMFDAASNVALTRTPSSASNRKTFTVSVWAKRGVLGDQSGSNTYGQRIFNAGTASAFFDLKWSGSGDTEGANRLHIREYSSSAEQIEYWTNRTFEDTSKWYHILLQVDTTQSTSTDRIKLYVDGDQITSWYRSNAPSLNFDTLVNSTVLHNVGRFTGATTNNLDGYLAEFNLVDGSTVAPSTFGVTDTSTGRWIPKTLSGITYGTNGFRLKFQDSSALGDDTSGNGNDYASSNLASTDQTTDSPTQNFTTVDPSVNPGSDTISEGNLKTVGGSSTYSYTVGTMRPKSGKYYAEFKVISGGGNAPQIGIAGRYSTGSTNHLGYNPTTYSYYFGGQVYLGLSTNSPTAWGDAYTDNDTIGVALDLDNNKLYFAKNNTWQNSSDPTTGANAIGIIPPENTKFGGYAFAVGNFEGAGGPTIEHNYGQRSFTYTPPTGYVALQQDNLPETAKGVTGMAWIKNRAVANHSLQDSSRGSTKMLYPDLTLAEIDVTQGVQRFLKGGCTVGEDTLINTASNSYVSWNWVANSGSTSSNTDGSITSTVQANTTAGFSIVQYTGTGSNATVGHGLSSAPEWFIVKELSNANSWIVSHKGLTSQATYSITLNNTNAESSSGGTVYWNSTAPTSSVFSLATDTGVNGSSRNYVAYCWHGVDGFSKFGKYVGNGSTNGPFIYTGFQPAMVMVKSSSNSATNWEIRDNKRSSSGGTNPITQVLYPNLSSQEFTTDNCDFLSNGFKWRSSGGNRNESGYTYIYMAFAEHPFVGDGTSPVTAR
jgi:hypothetical protein